MAAKIVMGAQWGDEGKGKVIDFLATSSDIVVRFNGGNNAGHTVKNKYGTFPMHLLPSGIFSPKAKACITNGVVLDLEVLITEIDLLEKAGFNLQKKLYISPRCHIIMPYHKILDRLYEEAKGKAKTGTTGRGIGPVYSDKVSYNGIRLYDLMNKKQFSEKLAIQLMIKNKLIQALGDTPLEQKTIEKQFFSYIKRLAPYIREPYPLLHDGHIKQKELLFEGAQAVFLDNDWGTYPFVTGSTILVGGINAAAGFPPQYIHEVIGVTKAYTTRVGAGPFPTELLDEMGETLRTTGKEFGVTTGRPRRCGWFDAEMLRFAAQINGFTSIALTKLDILDGFKEIPVCVGYEYQGEKVRYYDGDAVFLSQLKPVYKIMKGWLQKTNGITDYEKLPKAAKTYITFLEKQIGVPITYISTGPAREETIVRENLEY